MALADALDEAKPANAQIDEIVVTARKTSESLQRTPVAVTALDSATLAEEQIQTVADLTRTTPNLNISTGGAGPASLVFLSIRGQTQAQPSTSADAPVSTYVDGVYYARPTGGNLDLFDVKSAEILRGPQGTLFGRNTTGGAINLVTRDPTPQFEGLLKATGGNEHERRFEGVVNVPLSDGLESRASFRYEKNDGYGTIPRLDNRPTGDVDDYFARVKVKYAPRDAPFTIKFAADYENFKSSGQPTTVLGLNQSFALAPGFTLGNAFGLTGFNPAPYLSTPQNFRQSFGYADTGFGLDVPYEENVAYGTSITVNYDLGVADLTSITAFRRNITSDVLDLDGLPVNLVSFLSSYNQKQFSQELQLANKKTGRLQWITGAYFFRESSAELADSRSFSFLNPAAPLGRGTSGDTRNISTAAFGQINYDLADRLRMTAGIRYTWDDRQIVRHPLLDVTKQVCAIPAADRDMPGGACNQTQDARFSYPAWTFGFDYQLTDGLFAYVKTSGASEAGGWNVRGDFAPAFSPEKVRDVEAGFKADLLDRRLRTNVAVFHTWQYDAQRVIAGFDRTFNSSTQYVINAGNERLYGLEWEATALPWRGLEITANFAYLHSEYVKGTYIEHQTIAHTGPTPAGCSAIDAGSILCAVDRGGEPIPYAPKYNAGFGATQSFDLPFGKLSVHADYTYTSSKAIYSASAANAQPDAYKFQVAEANRLGIVQGYGLINGVATAALNNGWELSLFAKNIANKAYIQNVADFYISFGPVLGYTAPPRTFGGSVAYKW
jgi:iron complex outermembrane receptor protein